MEQIHAYAIRRIKEEIPREILEGTFIRRTLNQNLFEHISLDAAIKTAVLDASVFQDILLLTGRETNIDLTGLTPLLNSDGSASIHIPYDRTGGRDILECYRVGFEQSVPAYNGLANGNRSEVDIRVDAVIAGTGQIPITSTTECEVIAPNTILVNFYDVLPQFLNAQVNLTVDKEMGHIPPKAFETFGTLCVEKCKQYIYMQHRVRQGRGVVERGMEIGVYMEEINEYRDSSKNYRDLLKIWRRKEFHIDREKKTKFIKLITPSLL